MQRKMLLPELTLSRGLTIFIVIATTGTAILSVFHFYWGTRQVAKIEATYFDSVAAKSPGTDRKPDPNKPASASSFFDSIERFLLPDEPLLQKVVAVIREDSFQEAIKARPPQNVKEIVSLLQEHGVTEFGEVDMDQLIADAYESATRDYHANNPGKTPEDEDEAMAERFRELLRAHGPRDGVMKFSMNRENMMWIGVRFKGDQTAVDTWWREVIATYELVDAPSTIAAPDSPSDETNPGSSWAETEQGTSNYTQSELTEDPDTEKYTIGTPIDEPKKIVTKVAPEPPTLPTQEKLETTLSERFSKERFERAMETLERYGSEEGLRRLRTDDPEIAKQIESPRRDNPAGRGVPAREVP